MPAKGKRVASRQAQLNRRRRRQIRGNEEGVARAEELGVQPATTRVAPPPEQATPAVRPPDAEIAPQPSPVAAQSSERPTGQSRSGQPLAFTHLAGELRRILIMAAALTVVLVALSFLL